MLVWLDGRTNTKAQPQENFGREIMELFTMGVGNYTEADVYAAARVFTGWNLARPGVQRPTATQHYEFVYNANQHDTTRRRSAFRSTPTAARPFRRAPRPSGMQDGIDFIDGAGRATRTRRAIWRPSCIASSSASSAPIT